MSSDATDKTMRAELPAPDRTYADHSYPTYSPALVQRIVAEAVAAEREACAQECLRAFEGGGYLGGASGRLATQAAARRIRARSTPTTGEKS